MDHNSKAPKRALDLFLNQLLCVGEKHEGFVSLGQCAYRLFLLIIPELMM